MAIYIVFIFADPPFQFSLLRIFKVHVHVVLYIRLVGFPKLPCLISVQKETTKTFSVMQQKLWALWV